MDEAVLKRAMERRDEALREAERWQRWIKTYQELSERPDSPASQTAEPQTIAPGDEMLDIPSALRSSSAPTQNGKLMGLWPRGGAAE